MALTLRRTWPDRPYPKDDWLVMDDGVEVGQIEKNDTLAGEPRWEWALSSAAWRGPATGAWLKGTGAVRRYNAALRTAPVGPLLRRP
jgi:hypothetical protein